VEYRCIGVHAHVDIVTARVWAIGRHFRVDGHNITADVSAKYGVSESVSERVSKGRPMFIYIF